jgi:hypothetical protein
MYKQLHVNIKGALLANIGSSATYFPVDASTAAILQTAINFSGGDWTYLLLGNGSYSEEIKVTEVNSGYISVVRAQSDSTEQVFSTADTVITATFGKAAVEDSVRQAPQSIDFTLSGTGIASVAGPVNARVVNVAQPNFAGTNGVEVFGNWPNITIGIAKDSGGCCPGEGGVTVGVGDGTAITSINLSSSILQGAIASGVLSLSLATPSFSGAGGVSVTGTYPNYTISGAGISGGGGTTVAVGAGLSLTGSPTVNPTISISNTGVVAGDYQGFVVNARGQITNLPTGFAFIKDISLNYGTISITGGVAALTIHDADVGIRGAVAMANPAVALDTASENTAVSPAILFAQLNSLKGSAAGSMSGEPAASYTNTLSSTAVTLVLAAGEKAILVGDVVILNDAAPATPIAYGVSVFGIEGATTTKFYGSKILTQSKQCILGMVTGPFTGTVGIATTAIPTGNTVQGAYLSAMKSS